MAAGNVVCDVLRRFGKTPGTGLYSTAVAPLRQHLLDFLVAQHDLDDWLAAVLQGGVVVVHVRGYEHLGVPQEALARREVGDLLVVSPRR